MGSIMGGEILHQLSNRQVIEKVTLYICIREVLDSNPGCGFTRFSSVAPYTFLDCT
jgi:hypothetical protein